MRHDTGDLRSFLHGVINLIWPVFAYDLAELASLIIGGYSWATMVPSTIMLILPIVSDVAGTPILLDESTDPYLLHLIGLSAGDWAHALSAEAPDLKDGVYTVSVIIERVRPLDFVLN